MQQPSYHDMKLHGQDRQTRIHKGGIPEDKAQQAVETVLGFLRNRFPGSLSKEFEGFLEEETGSVGDVLGGLTKRPEEMFCK